MVKKIGKRGSYKKRSAEERFWDKVGPHADPTKCWLWQSNGPYGRFWDGAKIVLAYRLSYEMYYHVTIPKGMTIDHVKARGCISTLCVNPHHLEVVTLKVNILRGDSPSALHAQAIHCRQGHPFNKSNTYVDVVGKRHCRVCHRYASHR